MKNVLGIIQARMSSSRLPGKVLREVMGKPLLAYMTERIKPSNQVTKFMVATSTDSSDEPIDAWCRSQNFACYRGNLDDVLDRFYQCARKSKPLPEIIVRLTADCPLHHFEVIDFAVKEFMSRECDYFTNSMPEDLEDGFDVEVLSFKALEKAWEIRRDKFDKEHVTSIIKKKFEVEFQKYRPHYHSKLSIDTLTDFELTRLILENLYRHNHFFTMDDVIHFLNTQKVVQ